MEIAVRVSIIIPHYNNTARLQRVLEGIANQSWKQPFEVIVVDNGSTQSLACLKQFGFVHLIHEKRYLNSPYSARNRGIEKARGEYLAFIDATCVPESNWLEEGVKALANGADIVAGNIKFSFSGQSSIGELYDSVIHVNAEAAARSGFVLGGNFFIKSELYQTLGLYPEGQRTSGDFLFAHQVIMNGYKLVFCPSAIVYYPARSGRFIFKKNWRISQGQPAIWKFQGRFLIQFLKAFGKLVPPNPYKIYKRVTSRSDKKLSAIDWLKIYFLRYLMLVLSLFSNLSRIATGLFRK